ncbi:MAG: response regulator transcription factor [Acidobacteria bacterium]|nr:response regulator transcription factor [Acidobacteriota bacterium]
MAVDVLLVEDHAIVRHGIRTLLERSGDFRVVGEVDSGADAVQFCRKSPPQLVLMDLAMPGLNGIEATSEIIRHSPTARVVFLSAYDDDQSVVNAIRSGARGFVLKRASLGDLLDALRTVAKGGSYLSPQVSDRLLQRIQRGDLESGGPPSTLDGLSPREMQVMRMIADGMTSKEIAQSLDLGVETVRSYRKTLMKKLGVNNVAGLTQIAISAGITSPTAAESRTKE